MTSLLHYLHSLNLSAQQTSEALWALTEAGVISDCCLTMENVAEADCAAAIAVLKEINRNLTK